MTVDDLAPVDEFHIGGRAATESLLGHADLPARSRVLDIGSGVGGTARHLAQTGPHTVVGVDITPEYVEVATALTSLVGLDDSVSFRVGDVLDLRLAPATFDAAVQLHVGMNIENKRAAFAQVSEVLTGPAIFAIYDIMGPPDATVDFPVPWAGSPEASFLTPTGEYIALLEAVGFEVLHVADRSEFATDFFERLHARVEPPPHLGLHLLMGEEAPARYGNMVAAVRAGAIAPVEIIASLAHRD